MSADDVERLIRHLERPTYNLRMSQHNGWPSRMSVHADAVIEIDEITRRWVSGELTDCVVTWPAVKSTTSLCYPREHSCKKYDGHSTQHRCHCGVNLAPVKA